MPTAGVAARALPAAALAPSSSRRRGESVGDITVRSRADGIEQVSPSATAASNRRPPRDSAEATGGAAPATEGALTQVPDSTTRETSSRPPARRSSASMFVTCTIRRCCSTRTTSSTCRCATRSSACGSSRGTRSRRPIRPPSAGWRRRTSAEDVSGGRRQQGRQPLCRGNLRARPARAAVGAALSDRGLHGVRRAFCRVDADRAVRCDTARLLPGDSPPGRSLTGCRLPVRSRRPVIRMAWPA